MWFCPCYITRYMSLLVPATCPLSVNNAWFCHYNMFLRHDPSSKKIKLCETTLLNWANVTIQTNIKPCVKMSLPKFTSRGRCWIRQMYETIGHQTSRQNFASKPGKWHTTIGPVITSRQKRPCQIMQIWLKRTEIKFCVKVTLPNQANTSESDIKLRAKRTLP